MVKLYFYFYFKTSFFGHILKKTHIHFLVHGHSSWSTCPGSALKVKIRNTRECVLMAYPLQYLALK